VVGNLCSSVGMLQLCVMKPGTWYLCVETGNLVVV
jgi:hypothetical protein